MNQEDQLKGYEIGATDYIVKPYNIKILKEKVSSWISRRQYELLLKTLSNTLDSKVHQLSIVHEVLQHEVRNPIQLITHANYFIQRIRLLRQGNISEEENECWHQVEKITSGLSGLNSVLTTTKSIELDAITSQKAILLSEIITNAISQTEYLMHSVTFESFSEIDENCKVVCDKGMITQVLVNIIRNATESIRDCKSNEGGSIILRCENGENNTALIKIEDNGVGIAPEILPNLFRFKFSTKKDGSGIGLHLSRIILKMHGGNIDAKSEKGKGATFILTLLKF
jgi:signal transduction histidine kinase